MPHQSYQPSWPQSEQPLITAEDPDEFDADMAYLRGLATAIFEHATPAHLMRLAAFDRDRS